MSVLLSYDKSDILKQKTDYGVGKVENVKILMIQSYECETASTAYADLVSSGKQPAHYVVDATSVIKYAPSSTNLLEDKVELTPLAISLIEKKSTTSYYETSTMQKVPELIQETYNNIVDNNPIVKDKAIDTEYYTNYINIVEVCWGEDTSQYQAIADNLVKFLGYMISNHGFSTNNMWRAGDIIDFKDPEPEIGQRNPYQYTHLKDWHSLLAAVEYAGTHQDEPAKPSTFCFLDDDHKNVKRHCPVAVCSPEHGHSGHIHHWENDDRTLTCDDLPLISLESSTMKNEDYENQVINGVNTYKSRFQNEEVSQMNVQMENNYYEPIYPDMTCPPRNATSLYNEGVKTVKQILKKLTLAEQKEIEHKNELESQKDGYNSEKAVEKTPAEKFQEERVKPILGKIPNIFDPYPVDDKIVQLEHHAPMVTLQYEDAQHIQDDLTFYVINRFINTEKRLVQLENIMATQTRILNRLSSRIKINCVYYGGQSVFDNIVI